MSQVWQAPILPLRYNSARDLLLPVILDYASRVSFMLYLSFLKGRHVLFRPQLPCHMRSGSSSKPWRRWANLLWLSVLHVPWGIGFQDVRSLPAVTQPWDLSICPAGPWQVQWILHWQGGRFHHSDTSSWWQPGSGAGCKKACNHTKIIRWSPWYLNILRWSIVESNSNSFLQRSWNSPWIPSSTD